MYNFLQICAFNHLLTLQAFLAFSQLRCFFLMRQNNKHTLRGFEVFDEETQRIPLGNEKIGLTS